MGRLLESAEGAYLAAPREKQEEAMEAWQRGLTPVQARELERELEVAWQVYRLLAPGPEPGKPGTPGLPVQIEQRLRDLLGGEGAT